MRIPIPKFLEDLAIISKLGDNPGADDGLTASGLRAKFDEAVLKLQSYINDTVVETINKFFAEDAPPHEGMNMTGPINMNQQTLSGVKTPTADDHAANKEYVDSVSADNKEYVDTNFRPNTWLPTPEEIGAAKTVLWENESSTSTFADQTISLNLSGYKGIFVIYLAKTGSSGYASSGFIPVDGVTYCASSFPSDSGAQFKRSCQADLGSVRFGAGTQNGTQDNALMIPIKIYGVT